MSLLWWWSDAPIYDRADFGDFWERVAPQLDAHLNTSRGAWVFDHASYLCYQLVVRNWTLVNVDAVLRCPISRDDRIRPDPCVSSESMTYAQQRQIEAQHRGLSFIWTLAPSISAARPPRDRLLAYHTDRSLVRGAAVKQGGKLSTLWGCEPHERHKQTEKRARSTRVQL